MVLHPCSASDAEAMLHAMSQLAVVLEIDPRGRILRANERFEQLSGFREASLLGRPHHSLRSGIHPPMFWKQIWRTLSQGRTWQGEICNRAHDGRFYWLEALVSPIVSAQGEIEKYVCVGRHIASTQPDVAALIANQHMLTRTTSIAGVGGWYLDLQSGRLFMTDTCLSIWGIEPRSCSEAHADQMYFEPRSVPPALAALAAAVPSTGPIEQVEEFRHPSGGRRSIRLVGELELRNGRPYRVIGATQDITAQVTAQRRVEESQRILRSAIDEFGEAFALFDPEERLVFCNDLYRGIYLIRDDESVDGMRFEDMVRKAVERGAFPEVGDDRESWMARRLASFRLPRSEQKRFLADGRWLKVVDRTTPDRFRVSFRVDISDMQRALDLTDAASRSKSQFLANMSHEIRTPMNAVLGMLDLLSHTGLSAKQNDLAQKARKAARSLLGILNDILDYSKVEAGKMQLNPEPFVLDDLLRALSTILSGSLSGNPKPVELVFDIDPDIPALLVGDALRLQQALINLCGNAIKFTAEGEVVLGLSLLRFDGETARVRFSVRDTGIGISVEQQQHIFGSFSQANAATARLYGGTGLGLSISQRLVGLMGGDLGVSSTVGVGSVFSFEIDLPVAQNKPALSPQRGDHGLGGLSVLLVDDHELTRAAMARLLVGLGWSVRAFAGEAEALAWLETSLVAGHAPDVVLMDAGMPGGARLRERWNLWHATLPPQASVPLWIDITSVPFDLLRGCEGIRCATLVKPLTAGMVFETVASLRLGAPARDQAEQATSPQRLAGLNLLLVEDNPINQEIGLEMLRREGARVDLAENGRHGVDAVNRPGAAYDLVLMDMQMPEMDGLLATQAIRRHPRHRHLPIVAMTAYVMQEDREACLAVGMNGYVSKPFEIDALVRLILELTRGQAPVGSADLTPAVTSADAEALASPLDAEQAIQRLGQDSAFYARLLRSFKPSALELLERLRQHMDHGETVLAAAVAHQLKGAAAAIGAERLADACRRFERQARDGAPATQSDRATDAPAGSASLDSISVALDQTLALQARWLAAAPDAAQFAAAESVATLESDLEALLADLHDGSLEVFERFDALVAHHGAVDPQAWEAMRAAVEGFDPSAAEQVAKKIVRMSDSGC